MSGGISAIKGFDYQATVILEQLIDHFDAHGASAVVRPEDIDDLDLYWSEGSVEHRHYVQIKKPTEDIAGNLNPSPWTISEVIAELLPNAIINLTGNIHKQSWIVGDEVAPIVRDLIDAGQDAPKKARVPYWTIVNSIARTAAARMSVLDDAMRRTIRRAGMPDDLPADAASALASLSLGFGTLAKSVGASDDVAVAYRAEADRLHACLPNVLARISIRSTYGTEQQVALRVFDLLGRRYALARPVVENTLFRNLRGFISDISKIQGRGFDQEEFELELRSVWPQLVPIKRPPSLEPGHVRRKDMITSLTTAWSGTATEVVGISGSGKTMLASEIMEHTKLFDPQRCVYYAEVKTDTRMRDVLLGVAFMLRRVGAPELFSSAIDHAGSDLEMLMQLGRSFSELSNKTLMLVDLVDGTCSPAFARDLATFTRALSSWALPSANCRVIVFGHGSAFREFNRFEKDAMGVCRIDVRGFSFEEFVELVSLHHTDPDRRILWDVFERVTAGRAAGLYARLAHAIATSPSSKEMTEISQRPSEDVLSAAERNRFSKISEVSRSAAEKLVCFAVPFERRDAEMIFRDDNIGSAITELVELGLLRSSDDGSFEMHETVRAGLESILSTGLRVSAHDALAKWYGVRGQVTNEIFHLERAGTSDVARDLARKTFLRGEHWGALAAYIEQHGLVSADDVVSVFVGTTPVAEGYLFPDLLHRLPGSVNVERLLSVLKTGMERFHSDHQWGSAIVEGLLQTDPARLNEILDLVLATAGEIHQFQHTIFRLTSAARRAKASIDAATIALFRTQLRDRKRTLLPLMLIDWRRSVLQPILEFVATDGDVSEDLHGGYVKPFVVRVGSVKDTIEFLAAMPAARPAAMMISRSPLLGAFAAPIWSARTVLREHCLEIMNDAAADERVLANAIRVLTGLGEPTIDALCEPLLSRKNELGSIAQLGPALVPGLHPSPRYRARVLDASLSVMDRAAALMALSIVDDDLGSLYQHLIAAGEDELLWDGFFAMACCRAPFPEALPIVERLMRSAANDFQTGLVMSALTKLSGSAVPAVTALLVEASSHADAALRRCAIVGLWRRRSQSALQPLIERFAQASDRESIKTLAVGIVCSGARSVADIRNAALSSQDLRLWQCTLAARVRDASFADELVEIACDANLGWQLRRAAVFAAGRLDYSLALARIWPIIMAERSPLTLDSNIALAAHQTISWILLSSAQDVSMIFAQGNERFTEAFGPCFEDMFAELMDCSGLPAGDAAADWLYDRLKHHGWPGKEEAAERVIGELSVPLLQAAVLRALRMAARPDLIELQIPLSNSAWITIKAVQERIRSGKHDREMKARLRDLVASSAVGSEPRLLRIVEEIPSRAPGDAIPASLSVATIADAPVAETSCEAVRRALIDPNFDVALSAPLLLAPATVAEFEALAKLAAPTNDRLNSEEKFSPGIQFTSSGYVASRRTWTSKGGGDAVRGIVRPAIAAANPTETVIPWHQELLTGPFARTYVPAFLACLGAKGESHRLYFEIDAHPEALLPYMCNRVHVRPVMKFVDARMLPFLHRYASTGTDDVFEGLCALALAIGGPEVDPILDTLFRRWIGRFDLIDPIPRLDQNYPFWRAFANLSEHPRFAAIKDWQPKLSEISGAAMSWYNRESVTRVLERHPSSYAKIESLLFKATNWEHFHHEEIDRLDAAAQELFDRLLEP